MSMRLIEIQSGALLAAALHDDLDESEDEQAVVNRGSADEDSEELDEDFMAESESEVAEEFDSEHESSGSDDDEAMPDAGDQDAKGDSDTEMTERPKKKAKTDK